MKNAIGISALSFIGSEDIKKYGSVVANAEMTITLDGSKRRSVVPKSSVGSNGWNCYNGNSSLRL